MVNDRFWFTKEVVDRMTDAQLSILKQQLRQRMPELSPASREALLYRIQDIPKLADVMQPAPKVSTAQQLMQRVGMPSTVGEFFRTPMSFLEQWGKGAAATVLSPFYKRAEKPAVQTFETPFEAYQPTGPVRSQYELWTAPPGVKGGVELLAELPFWMAAPGASATTGMRTFGAIAREPTLGLAERGVARLGQAALAAPAAAETLLTLPFRGLSALAGKVGGKIIETDALKKVETMWQRGKVPTTKNIPDRLLKLQEQFNDIYYGLRRMQTQVEKRIEIPPGTEKDIITLLTRAPGAANAGATRYILTINEIKGIAPNIVVDDINTIIFVNHAKEVLLSKGTQRVMAGGFKTTAELDNALIGLQRKLGAKNYGKAEQAAKVVQRIYQEERKRLVQEGFISEELGRELAQKYPWYNPLHYVEYTEREALRGKSVRPYTVISSGLRRLSEKGTEKEAVAPLEVLGDQLIRNEVRIHQNQTAKAIVKVALEEPALGVKKVTGIRPVAQIEGEAIFRPTKGEIPGTLSFFEKGKRQIYEVPDFIYREACILSRTISNPVSSFIGALNGISRAAFTSFSPPFVVSNMLNDMLTAFISRGILPTQTGMRLIGSLKGLTNDKIMQAFRLAGGYQQRFYGRSAKELAREVGVSGGKIAQNNWSFRKIITDSIPRAGEAGEQAPRMALFQRELNKNLPNWRNMTVEDIAKTPQARKAAADAVELTINFGRGAYLIKAANPFVIFLNANMEAMKLPFRFLSKNPAARWRLAGIGAATAGVTAYNLSYPEYFDVPNSIRWGSFMIMLPSKEKDERGNPKPNYVTIVPRTREWGAFLGSLTYAMEKLFSDSPTGLGKFGATMAPMLFPIAEIPAPQILGELYEQGANWDFYRSSPIVPEELQGLPPSQQTSPWVSRTIQEIANTVDISPLRLQHVADGIFGGAGRAFTSMTDFIANLIIPPGSDPRIVNLAEQYKSLSRAVERNQFLMNLTSEDKEAMFNQLRQPEKGIPIISPILKRVMPERGGQLYRTGQELAEQATGISAQQTQKAYRTLSRLSSLYLDKQKGLDQSFAEQKISGAEWRESRAELGQRYQGALDTLGIQLPNAAQVQQDKTKAETYYDMVNTLARTMTDRRERAEVLAAGWYAIDLQELSPGTKDWATFSAMKQGYKDSLSPEDRNLLEEYLLSRMTRTEQLYNKAQVVLAPYWQIEDKIWSRYPPQAKEISDRIDILERTNPQAAKELLKRVPSVMYARNLILEARHKYRQLEPAAEYYLNLFYRY